MSTPDWHEEARALRAERLRLKTPIERVAFDNQWSKNTGLPVGVLMLALEHEEQEAAITKAKERRQ